MSENAGKFSIEGFQNLSARAKSKIIAKLDAKLNMSYSTFAVRVRTKTFKPGELELLDGIVAELFPNGLPVTVDVD